MRAVTFAAAALAAIVALPHGAHAVIVDGGFLKTDGTNVTVDLYEFTVSQNITFSLGLTELDGSPPPIGHPATNLYLANGTLVASAAATSAGTVNLSAPIGPGSYILAVSEAQLLSGNFGPLNAAATNKVGYQYEFGISGNQTNFITTTCDYTGNLNGTFTLKSGIASCSATPVLPLTPIATPEPAAILLLGPALLGLAAVRSRARTQL